MRTRAVERSATSTDGRPHAHQIEFASITETTKPAILNGPPE
jgi:hypothetical protein